MKSIRYHLDLGDTAACTKILTDETKGMEQKALKGSIRDFFLFEIWFSSKRSAEVAASVGVDLIGMVKTNTKEFCKATIEWLMKDWHDGSCIVLRRKPMVPGGGPLLDIIYK